MVINNAELKYSRMKFVAKTLYGLEKVLAEELTVIGASDVQAVNRAVLFKVIRIFYTG